MDEHFSKKAFDIGEIPKNINLDLPPVTGLDYLYRVRLETRKCPKVVVSTIDTSQFLERQTVQVDVYNGFVRARPGFEPETSWQKEQLENFQNLRDRMAEDRAFLKEKFKNDKPVLNARNLKEEDWCAFCLGSEKKSKIYRPISPEDGVAPKSKKSRLSGSDGSDPLLSIVVHMRQPVAIKVLKYHVTWLEKIGFSHKQGRWLYAILMILEKPLDPDTCALLRRLSRICSQLRNDLDSPKNDFVHALNLILCIIAHYFDQKDMSDHFSEDA